MEFNGAALYTAKEIKSALSKYEILLEEYHDELEKATAKYLDDNEGKKGWHFFIFPLKMSGSEILYEGVNWSGKWRSVWDKLKDLGYVKGIFPVDFLWRGNPMHLDLYIQIKNLTNGGKDCYLNPTQAWFINKYKQENL